MLSLQLGPELVDSKMVKIAIIDRQTVRLDVQKRRIRASKFFHTQQGFHFMERLFPQGYTCSFFKYAEKCFQFYTRVACKLCLVPFAITADGKLENTAPNKLMPLVENTKTAVLVSSLAILAMVVAGAVTGFSIGMEALPVTLFTPAVAVGFYTS